MKTIRNKTQKPIRLQLHGGKTLHLGPARTGQVADRAVESPSLRKRIDAGEIEVLDDGDAGSASGDGPGRIHESTHGHPQPTMILPKGNR